MANILESVFRLSDEYTATVQKIISSASSFEKQQQEAEKAANNFNASLKNVGNGSNSAANGIGAIALKIGGFVTAAELGKKAVEGLFGAIKTGAQQQVQMNTFKALMGNQQLGADMYNYVAAYAQNSALGRGDLADAATSFLAYTKDVGQIQQLLDMVQRLYMFNPEQGAQGAVFALKEVMAGQNMSLKRRYNMIGISDDVISKNAAKGDYAANIKYVSDMMNKYGASQAVVTANTKSLMVQTQQLGTNFQNALGNEANPAVQSLTQTVTNLNDQMKAGQFQNFFNAVAAGASNLAQAGIWLSQNFQTVIPTVAAVIGAFAAYKLASEAVQMTTAITGIIVSSATGNWIGLAAAIAGAAGAGLLASKFLSSPASGDATKQMLSAQQAAANLTANQKKFGASTLGNAAGGTADVNVANKDPIKVSGSVEIEKENLKYMFDAATAKFFATFNATKVEPTLTIQHQEVTEKADVQEINQQLAAMLGEASGVTAGGNYA